jgi:hypothetical protein
MCVPQPRSPRGHGSFGYFFNYFLALFAFLLNRLPSIHFFFFFLNRVQYSILSSVRVNAPRGSRLPMLLRLGYAFGSGRHSERSLDHA